LSGFEEHIQSASVEFIWDLETQWQPHSATTIPSWCLMTILPFS